MTNLIEILPEKFRSGLTEAERKLLVTAQEGVPSVFLTGDKEKDDPANAADWGPDRTVRADVIYWLCTYKPAIELVHAKGIWIEGAKIAGPLNLECVDIPHRLVLAWCALESVTLIDASARTLAFNDSVIGGFVTDRLRSFDADRLKMSGSLLMLNVKAIGQVGLLGADIDGDFECDGAEFDNPKGYALSADRIKVKGSVFFRNGFKASGAVRLLGADIGGDLSCIGAKFNNPACYVLNANLFLLTGIALHADGIKVKGGIFLRAGFKAVGEVRFLGAEIGGNLDCGGAEFNNPGGNSLHADGIKVKGSVFLRNGFKASGAVRLLGADIGGGLSCIGAEFKNPPCYVLNADLCGFTGIALHADGVKVKGNVFFRDGFKASGEVRLLGADIGGGLECDGAEFDNPKGYALNADGIMVKGSVFLRYGFKAVGAVRLPGTNIGGDLDCGDAELNNPDGDALICQNARITGALVLLQMKGLVGALNLTHATAGMLVDDETSWPEKGNLYIDGFEYGGLPGVATPKTASARLDWLSLQPTRDKQGGKIFYPRPYEQLAKVFRDMGQALSLVSYSDGVAFLHFGGGLFDRSCA